MRGDQATITEQPDTEDERVEEESEDTEMSSSEGSSADMITFAREGQEPPLEQRWELRLHNAPGFFQFL